MVDYGNLTEEQIKKVNNYISMDLSTPGLLPKYINPEYMEDIRRLQNSTGQAVTLNNLPTTVKNNSELQNYTNNPNNLDVEIIRGLNREQSTYTPGMNNQYTLSNRRAYNKVPGAEERLVYDSADPAYDPSLKYQEDYNRAVELQKLKNQNELDVAAIRNIPENTKLEFIKSQEPFRQYSILQELENNAASQGIQGPDTTGMGLRQYQKMLSDPTYAAIEDSIKRKLSSGINIKDINFTENELTHLRANMPGIIPEKQTVISPEKQTVTNVIPTLKTQPRNRQTFESIYGESPILKDIWEKDEELKRQREKERKLQWTVPY